jgi:deazaflavin-dependent oxidoreductase (nitroreductase family)
MANGTGPGTSARTGTEDEASMKSEKTVAEPVDFNALTIAEFRANHGQVGGNFAGAPMLLLHTVGARSGAARINPMMYLPDQGRYLVIASKGGSDRNPDWYYNLLAHPEVRIEVGDEILTVHAVELLGAERDAHFAEQARRYPGFAAYQRGTERIIPVIALTPTGALTAPADSTEGNPA